MDEHEDGTTDDGTTAEPKMDEPESAKVRKPMYQRNASPAPGYNLPRLNTGHRRRGFHQDAPDDEE